MNDPTDAAQRYLRDLTTLVKDTARAQSGLVKHSAQLAQDTLAGRKPPGEAAREYWDAVVREGTRYGKGVTRVSTTYGQAVVVTGAALADKVFKRATSSPGGATSDTHQEGTRPASITLRGPRGARATGQVTVANRHSRPRRINLTAGPLTTPGEAPALALTLDPRTLTVPAGEERDVRLAADLSAEGVRAGAEYTTTLQISGGDEATLVVRVRVAD